MEKNETALARWSRLKRKQASQAVARRAPEESTQPPKSSGPAASDQLSEPFNVASLPSIDSIVAGSDVRAFLQKGVPAALTRAALRRAWSSDPAVRDFIEMAENQWDFASPGSIPGFG